MIIALYKKDIRSDTTDNNISTSRIRVFTAPGIFKQAVVAPLLVATMISFADLHAQQQPEDSPARQEQDDLMSLLEESPKNSFDLKGFAEISSDTGLSDNGYGEQSFYNIGARTKFRPAYSSQKFKAYADIDFFAKSYSHVKEYSFETSEFYIEGENSLLWKAGKQRFNWGVADIFSIANPMDQIDLRESFARNNDEKFSGVYALRLTYIKGDYAIEAAARPVTEPLMRPAGFYAIHVDSQDTPAGTVTPVYNDTAGERQIKNGAFALRGGGTTSGLDWHLFVYSGPQPRSAYSSTLERTDTGLNLTMEPVFDRVTIFGVDAAYAMGKLNTRFEGIYSPDMIASEKIDDQQKAAAMAQIMGGSDSAPLQDGTRRNYYSYGVGADYNLWGNYGTVYCEWMQARFVDESDIEKELQSDILALRIEDSFFSQALNLSAGSMIRIENMSAGYALTAEAEYDFKDGLTATAGAYYFVPNDDSYMKLFEDMSMIYLRMKFNF